MSNYSDLYEAYYGLGKVNYTALDLLRAIAIMFLPPVACISFVLICVYLCLVRPLEKQRRRMFRACTASSAAFIAQSYMTRIEMAPGVKKTTLATVHEKAEESDDNKEEEVVVATNEADDVFDFTAL